MLPAPNDVMSGSPVPVGPGPAASGGEEMPNPETIKKQLVMLLTKAKEMAKKSGVDFSAVVAEVEGKDMKSDVPMPRPPKAEGMP